MIPSNRTLEAGFDDVRSSLTGMKKFDQHLPYQGGEEIRSMNLLSFPLRKSSKRIPLESDQTSRQFEGISGKTEGVYGPDDFVYVLFA